MGEDFIKHILSSRDMLHTTSQSQTLDTQRDVCAQKMEVYYITSSFLDSIHMIDWYT